MNILVTDYQGTGDDVMVFTKKVTAEMIKEALDVRGHTYNEIYEVPDKELGYYIYDPLHLPEKTEQGLLSLYKLN